MNSSSFNTGLQNNFANKPVSMNSELEEARETLDILFEISQILNCGLDKQTLSLLTSLCENGVNPQALAEVVKELQREAMSLNIANN